MQSSKNSNSRQFGIFDKTFDYKNKNPNYSNSSKNLTMSIGSGQSPSKFTGGYKRNFLKKDSDKQIILEERDDGPKDFLTKQLSLITQENSRLRQQNQLLKKQINKFKYQSRLYLLDQKNRVTFNQPFADLRGTIKKQNQTGQTKQLKIKLQVLSKQCKMYEQIIDKMQQNIKCLNQQNKILKQNKKLDRKLDADPSSQIKKEQLQNLKEKVNLVMKQYSSLQSKMHSHQLQWIVWKQQWTTQKNVYISRIRTLQAKLKHK